MVKVIFIGSVKLDCKKEHAYRICEILSNVRFVLHKTYSEANWRSCEILSCSFSLRSLRTDKGVHPAATPVGLCALAQHTHLMTTDIPGGIELVS